MLRIWVFVIACVYMVLGLMSLGIAFINPSFMERLKGKEQQAAKILAERFSYC